MCNRVLAVIPARGGSKGIPRKNMRLMNGHPLIYYAITNALKSKYITDVVVSSDSQEILAYSRQWERVTAIDRRSVLAQDAVTLDPVIYDAVVRKEEELGSHFDIVVTLQPTSPLLSVATLDKGIEFLIKSKCSSVMSVVNSPHLSWIVRDGQIVPGYTKRLNRQQLPPNYLETGAFVISKRNILSAEDRLGDSVNVFEVPYEESIDIDTKQDWIVCESIMSRKTIVFRVDGYQELGMGHIYRVLTLAYDLIEHDIVFICNKKHKEGIKKLKDSNMRVVEIESDEDLFSWLEINSPDIFVNDCLDTDMSYVNKVKSYVKRFVSFEDLGTGARVADAVVNALYEGASSHSNVYSGKKFVCLRDEFLTSERSQYRESVKRVFVSFGGTDPLNLTYRVFEMAKKINANEVNYEFDFVLGPGYKDKRVMSDEKLGIKVSQNVVRMSDHMKLADVAFSSQGRTTFELASVGVPSIVLAQNEREQLHTFAQMEHGFINLGLGDYVSDEDLRSTLEWLISTSSIRKEMRNLMLKTDLRSGIKRVRRIILGDVE